MSSRFCGAVPAGTDARIIAEVKSANRGSEQALFWLAQTDSEEALDLFGEFTDNVCENGGWSAAIGGSLPDGTPAYNDGVAVVTLTRFGVMGEFTISGARFSYKPTEAK